MYDYALVGGGLQSCLIALAVRAARPAATVAIVERGAALGGNHTWCFHAGDLSPRMAALVAGAVVACWEGYDVAFPAHARTLASPYACATSERLAGLIRRSGAELHLGTVAREVHAGRVVTDRGELRARRVIDARGPDRVDAEACGWQKFLGQEIELAAPHGLARPIVMDATVAQVDGLRFFYVLPLAPSRLLVEDTYFSDGTHLDASALRGEIAVYAEARGWAIARVVREETGVLPLPWIAPAPDLAEPLVAGYAGGWYHPTTGYSFPLAARLAEAIAADDDLAGLARAHAAQFAFALRLNKMLFRWFAPANRFRVLERFYRLPEPAIRRFYALRTTALDRARMFVGRPPRGLSVRGMFGGVP